MYEDCCFVFSLAGLIFIRMLELFQAAEGRHLEEGQAVGALEEGIRDRSTKASVSLG